MLEGLSPETQMKRLIALRSQYQAGVDRLHQLIATGFITAEVVEAKLDDLTNRYQEVERAICNLAADEINQSHIEWYHIEVPGPEDGPNVLCDGAFNPFKVHIGINSNEPVECMFCGDEIHMLHHL